MESQEQQLELYIDWASQPSRAILVFVKMNKIPFTLKEIRIGKGQHLSQEFIQINPNKTVPAMREVNQQSGINKDFCLFESHSIMRYLANTRNNDDNYYPKCPYKRAKVDQYLDWHHSNLRQGLGFFIFKKLFAPKVIGKSYKEEELKDHKLLIEKSLKQMERVLSENKYLCGDQITIADISSVCELSQKEFIKYDISKYTNLNKWYNHLMNDFESIKEIHKPMFRLIEINQKAKL